MYRLFAKENMFFSSQQAHHSKILRVIAQFSYTHFDIEKKIFCVPNHKWQHCSHLALQVRDQVR